MKPIDKIEIIDRGILHVTRIVYKDDTEVILYPRDLRCYINKLIESHNNHMNYVNGLTKDIEELRSNISNLIGLMSSKLGLDSNGDIKSKLSEIIDSSELDRDDSFTTSP